MLYIANLTSIILFTFAISFLVAEPWNKSQKNISDKNEKQTAKLTKNRISLNKNLVLRASNKPS